MLGPLPATPSEWPDPDLSNPLGQVFGLMPPETQEAMIKAVDGGADAEFHCDGKWEECDDPSWNGSIAYRVKPAPIRETVTLIGNAKEGFDHSGWSKNTHTITLTIIDGEVQPTATVEPIK